MNCINTAFWSGIFMDMEFILDMYFGYVQLLMGS